MKRPELLAIHHVAVICSDYPRSKAFYSEVLGLNIIAEHYRPERDSWKLDLQLPDKGQLELFSFPASPPRPSRPEALGLRHLAFKVDNVQQFADYLIGLNVVVEPLRTDEYTGKIFTFFQDPDGLPLELYQG